MGLACSPLRANHITHGAFLMAFVMAPRRRKRKSCFSTVIGVTNSSSAAFVRAAFVRRDQICRRNFSDGIGEEMNR